MTEAGKVKAPKKSASTWFSFGLILSALLWLGGLLWIDVLFAYSVISLSLVGASASNAGLWKLIRCMGWIMLAWVPLNLLSHGWVSDISAFGVFPLVVYLSLYPALHVGMVGLMSRYLLRPLEAKIGNNPLGFSGMLWFWSVLLLGALTWTTLEVVKGEMVWGGYAFDLVGHGAIDRSLLAWLGPFVGAYGTGFIMLIGLSVCFVALSIGSSLLGEKSLRLRANLSKKAIAGFVLSACGVIGQVIFIFEDKNPHESPADRSLPAFVVLQTNVPQDNREDWSTESRLETLAFIEESVLEAVAEHENIRAIVIPETMFPGRFGLEPSAVDGLRQWGLVLDDVPLVMFRDRLVDLQAEAGVPFVVGASAYDGLRFEVGDDGGIRSDWDAVYNSVYVIANGEVQPERFDKVHLTPFGEVMPLISRWEWLEQQLLAIGARGMTFALSQGRAHNTLAIGEAGDDEALRFAAPICFEATDQSTVRELVFGRDENGKLIRRADFIINGTNDGWFGNDDRARRGHLMASRWRALELGTPMIRAANTGVSAIIDAKGRIVAEAPVREWATLVGRVPPAEGGPTFYARTGNVVGWACVVTTGVMIALAIWRRKGDRAAEEKIEEDADETPNTGAGSA